MLHHQSQPLLEQQSHPPLEMCKMRNAFPNFLERMEQLQEESVPCAAWLEKRSKRLCTAQIVRCLCALCQHRTASGVGTLRDTNYNNPSTSGNPTLIFRSEMSTAVGNLCLL
ncbi:hypothetical protein ABG768_018948 [Culter alburnus]|uniref:Uncharacterized protein n=1 Tax=Culter alburnus TaxID=194366 RepID=A0AAW2AUF4_CULAL